MLAGMRLDVFTPLDKTPMSVDSLAESLRVGTSKLSPLMYALAAAGLLTVRDSVFANTGESSYYLVKGKPNYVGSRHQLLSDLWGATLQAAETVRTGVPQARHDFSTMSRNDLEAFLAPIAAREAKLDLSKLSPRERAVLDCLRTGAASPDIGHELGISVHTARNHIKAIYGKLGVHSAKVLTARLGSTEL